MICALLMTGSVSAYGTRNWLGANQHFSKDQQHHRNERGYNHMLGARRTTIHTEDDRTGWMYEGDLRNNNASGRYHWKKEEKRRY
ncbi:hypothetical protein [Thiogranum longum]|nr:hypothetical protein [Thiogranum longum]